MSKRKSQTAVDDYIAQGFVREGLVNFLALLGWSTGTEEEILPVEELVARFDLESVNRAGAVFDRERLEWVNGQWIRLLPPDELAERLLPFLDADRAAGRIDRMPTLDEVRTIVPLVQERLPVLGSVGEMVGFLYVDAPDLDPAAVDPEALGPRHDRRPGSPPRARRSRRTARSRSTRRASRPRCGRSPRRAAGRRGTCSWPSASR